MTEQTKTSITINTLARMKQAGEKIVVLTTYDASFTRLLERAGIEILLVGDTLGMVIQGHKTTLPVTLEDMIYHSANVARARTRALLLVDMPFMSYNTPAQALENAGRLMKEGGAHMVKLEGGAVQAEVVRHLANHGVPVCAHLGLVPQSVHKLGGYRVQGRDEGGARDMLADAQALQGAGADLLVLECVPVVLAGEISRALQIPVIGIGAGPDCDGQVLVLYDMLGLYFGKPLRFTKDFLAQTGSIEAALRAYVAAVKRGEFPGPEHSFS